MKHAAAIVFLEQAVKRLDSTIKAKPVDPRKDDFIRIKTEVEESIELLKALQWIDVKATEIRSRKD